MTGDTEDILAGAIDYTVMPPNSSVISGTSPCGSPSRQDLVYGVASSDCVAKEVFNLKFPGGENLIAHLVG